VAGVRLEACLPADRVSVFFKTGFKGWLFFQKLGDEKNPYYWTFFFRWEVGDIPCFKNMEYLALDDEMSSSMKKNNRAKSPHQQVNNEQNRRCHRCDQRIGPRYC